MMLQLEAKSFNSSIIKLEKKQELTENIWAIVT